MEKKILIAVDNSRHSKNAVIYTAQMSSTIKNMNYVTRRAVDCALWLVP